MSCIANYLGALDRVRLHLHKRNKTSLSSAVAVSSHILFIKCTAVKLKTFRFDRKHFCERFTTADNRLMRFADFCVALILTSSLLR